MSGWSIHAGTALRLMQDNVDTDQLLPARFMSQPRSAGYGEFLLHDLRRNAQNELLKDFALNLHPNSSVLICGRNFGSGSSREAAVYALADAGIRVMVSTSFGDIFAANAINNGLLPAVVNDSDMEQLNDVVQDGVTTVSVNLNTLQICADKHTLTFHVDATWITKLINGWDDIDLTLDHADSISLFRQQHRLHQNWAWPEAQQQVHSTDYLVSPSPHPTRESDKP